ncbi:MAG: OmpA family protein [Fluviicoccus sp.]|uniref:OmpA family protein n=1 Tax=Fluviicoccus sp. TaxID=2003552 RepID=UPI002722EE3A|nr:OmpA family protein [Fluviicoccus sp.]MDO8330659.1 OmpA family protein [Fluviicoccus sp.]
MKLMTIGKRGVLALAIIASPYAAAGDTGWYGGVSLGNTRAIVDDERLISSLLANGFTTTGIDDDGRDHGWKLLAGYQFNRNFALEGGYFDLKDYGFTATTLPAGTLNGRLRVKGLNLDAVGILPITEKFSALGRAGVNYADTESRFAGTGSVHVLDPSRSKRDLNFKVGLGLQYDVTKSLGVRAEAERYRIDDTVGNTGDIDLVSLGVVYRFGGREEVPVVVAPLEKEPVAVAPAPVLVVVPVAAQNQQYCSILDIQFEIDKEDIQREEKERLSVLGTFMKKYPDTTAVIEGHSDNVGAPEYNLELSRRRAESVVRYLTDTFQIVNTRLTAVGYGDTRPLVDNSTEEGKRQNRRIDAVIACVSDIEGLTVKPARMTMAMAMEFDRDQADVKPEYTGDLVKVANFLKANPKASATVEGHTGNLQANAALAMDMSQRRAQSVVDYLVNNLGVNPNQLKAEGFGGTRRFAYNTSLEGQQENRRVNIIINYAK